MNEEQIRGLIAEANRPLQEAVTNLTAENTRLREALVVRDGAERVRQKLATVALPQVTKQRLQESLTLRVSAGADGRLDVAALDAAIEEAVRAEGEYLASVTGRPVRGMGATNVSESQQPTEAELAEAFTALGLSESAAKFAAAGR
jgi:hypothetical protein